MAKTKIKINKTKFLIITLGLIGVAITWLYISIQSAQAPKIYLANFEWSHHYGSPPYISVSGTIVNSSPSAAYNVSLVIQIYVEGVSPHGWYTIGTKVVDLGNILGNSSRYFDENIPYTGSIYYRFRDIVYDVVWTA